jgi:DNA-binding transcriptional LysR family regulator
MLDLWALRVLVAVADAGSFSGATTPLALTQPAISRQITNLEKRVGTLLFVRLPRGVRPTHAGEIAIDQARAILARVIDLESHLRDLAGLDAGRIRLAAFPSANISLVPTAVADFTHSHPGISVTLVPSRHAVDAVRTGEIDLGLVTDLDHPPTRDGVTFMPLVEDELFIALARDHKLARSNRVRLSDLGAETWIEGVHPDCLGNLDNLAKAIGAPPNIGYTCEDWNAKQSFVAAGLGISIFPGLAAAHVRDDIVLRRPNPDLPARKISLVMLAHPYCSAATAAMAGVLAGRAGGFTTLPATRQARA